MLGWEQGSVGMYSMVREAGVDLEKLELHGNGRSVEVADLDQAILYEKMLCHGPRALEAGIRCWIEEVSVEW